MAFSSAHPNGAKDSKESNIKPASPADTKAGASNNVVPPPSPTGPSDSATAVASPTSTNSGSSTPNGTKVPLSPAANHRTSREDAIKKSGIYSPCYTAMVDAKTELGFSPKVYNDIVTTPDVFTNEKFVTAERTRSLRQNNYDGFHHTNVYWLCRRNADNALFTYHHKSGKFEELTSQSEYIFVVVLLDKNRAELRLRKPVAKGDIGHRTLVQIAEEHTIVGNGEKFKKNAAGEINWDARSGTYSIGPDATASALSVVLKIPKQELLDQYVGDKYDYYCLVQSSATQTLKLIPKRFAHEKIKVPDGSVILAETIEVEYSAQGRKYTLQKWNWNAGAQIDPTVEAQLPALLAHFGFTKEEFIAKQEKETPAKAAPTLTVDVQSPALSAVAYSLNSSTPQSSVSDSESPSVRAAMMVGTQESPVQPVRFDFSPAAAAASNASMFPTFAAAATKSAAAMAALGRIHHLDPIDPASLLERTNRENSGTPTIYEESSNESTPAVPFRSLTNDAKSANSGSGSAGTGFKVTKFSDPSPRQLEKGKLRPPRKDSTEITPQSITRVLGSAAGQTLFGSTNNSAAGGSTPNSTAAAAADNAQSADKSQAPKPGGSSTSQG